MVSRYVRACVGTTAFVLFVFSVPATTLAQQARVSFRVAPIGVRNASPLFKIDIVDATARRGVTFPSMTVTKTRSGPQVTNLALAFPELTLGELAVSSRVGDQSLPRVLLSSPLAGSSVKRPIRGLTFSTAGATPWTLSVGRLDGGPSAAAPESGASTVVAIGGSLSPFQRLSFAPRLLVPLGADAGATNLGTTIRAEVGPGVSVVSDVGAADTTLAGWSPIASAGIVGQWTGSEIETSVLRGAPSSDTERAVTVSAVDRQYARGRLQPLPGLTVSGLASRSRPASAPDIADTTVGSVGVVYDRFLHGQLAATRRRELSSWQETETTRIEWRHASVSGFVVRYTETRETPRDPAAADQAAKLVEVDLPAVTQHVGRRLNFRAALTADASPAHPAIGSRVTGRFDVFDEVALAGETELRLASAGQHVVRALRLATEVEVLQDTALQLLYTYRADTPFSFAQAFEARISRAINLIAW